MSLVEYKVKISSPIGEIGLIFSEQGLLSLILSLEETKNIFIPAHNLSEYKKFNKNILKLIQSAIEQLDKYFQGKPIQFSIPVVLNGTPFQIKVWQELMNIPYGETVTYGQIAQRINKPKAYRAVGSACAQNRIPILIPCHRVIAFNGKLGGFSAGLEVKRWLLQHEKNSQIT